MRLYSAVLFTVLLTWTNPPDLDLRYMRVCTVTPDSLTYCYIYEGTCNDGGGDSDCDSTRLVPNATDHIEFLVPCHTGLKDYHFYVEPGDTAGNFAEPSNVVVKTL